MPVHIGELSTEVVAEPPAGPAAAPDAAEPEWARLDRLRTALERARADALRTRGDGDDV